MVKKTLFLGWTVCHLLSLAFVVNAAPIDDFVTTWKTDNPGVSNDTSIQIRTNDSLTYSYNVDWDNDGVFDEFGITGDTTHDFGTVGTYTIRINGDFPQIYLRNQGDKDKIIAIDQWGTSIWETMSYSFHGASNLVNKAQDTPNLSMVTDMSFMFQVALSIGGPDDTGNWQWDTSNVENFVHLFFQARAFNKDIGSWNTSAVDDMAGTFFQANDFNQNLESWNFEHVDRMIDFVQSSDLNNDNYDSLLISLSNQNVNSSVSFGATGIKYCSQAASDARDFLINDLNWTIEDSGREPSCNPTPDLKVRIINFDEFVAAGQLVDYMVQVENIGSQDVIDATFEDILPPELIASSWTCTPIINSCSASGVGQINDVISIASDSVILYNVSATVTNDFFLEVFYQAEATINDNQTESDYSNNYDSYLHTNIDINDELIFRNNFETPVILLNNKQQFTYDFSNIDISQLTTFPKPFAQNLNESNEPDLWIHIRKYEERVQTRTSSKQEGIWLAKHP